MKLKSKKSALLLSFTSLLLCFAMLAGSTFAWFTDTATTGVNKIVSGKLDVDIVDAADTTKSLDKQTLKWVRAKSDTGKEAVDSAEILWEPGCTYQLQPFKIANKGNLALKYKIQITGIQGDAKLNEVIEWKINGAAINLTEKSLAAATANGPTYSDEITISGHMKEKAGNEYQNKSIDGIAITVYATQDTVENDSFNNTYDENATYYPVLDAAGLKDALVNGGEIQVVEDVRTSGEDTVEARMTVSKPTTLQLDKKIISPDNMGNNEDNFVALIVDADTTINAGPEGGIDTGTNGGYAINVRNGAKLTINSGDYYGGGTAVQVQKGELIINGGFFAVEPYSNPVYGNKFLLNCIDAALQDGSAKITVYGGTFVNYDPSDSASENPHGNFVADGYSVISETKENGDKWYTVVKGQGATAGTAEEMQAAIAANKSYIRLTGNVDVSEVLTFENETTIDLNGKTLRSSMESGYSLVLNGDTVIKNGTYQGTGTARGITANGNLTLENVKVDVAGQVGVACSKENCTYSIQDSEIKGDYALANFAENATVTIQGSTLEGKNCGLYHNGSNSGLKLNVTDTTINGGNDGADATGVYISGSTVTRDRGGYQQATFTNCTIKGNAAVEVKYTDLTLNNCTATATVAAENASYTQNNNGSTTNGFAVVSTDNATNNTMPKPEGTITINGGSYTGLIGLNKLSSVAENFPGFVDTTYIIQ